ncbi:hypothetical protein [Ornithinimicrobium kibberense]|uniref:hypothetical protein n=1 Tax=Ornithinimicrobium kibberense TaxID=282060 RepID=UPI0036125DA1
MAQRPSVEDVLDRPGRQHRVHGRAGRLDRVVEGLLVLQALHQRGEEHCASTFRLDGRTRSGPPVPASLASRGRGRPVGRDPPPGVPFPRSRHDPATDGSRCDHGTVSTWQIPAAIPYCRKAARPRAAGDDHRPRG